MKKLIIKDYIDSIKSYNSSTSKSEKRARIFYSESLKSYLLCEKLVNHEERSFDNYIFFIDYDKDYDLKKLENIEDLMLYEKDFKVNTDLVLSQMMCVIPKANDSKHLHLEHLYTNSIFRGLGLTKVNLTDLKSTAINNGCNLIAGVAHPL